MPVEQDDDCERGGTGRTGEMEVGRAHAEDVSKKEMHQIERRAGQIYDDDAGAKQRDEEGAKCGILFYTGEPAERGAAECREEACYQCPEEQCREARTKGQIRQPDARQEGMGKRIAHECEPAQDEKTAEDSTAHAKGDRREQAALHEFIAEWLHQQVVEAHWGNSVVRLILSGSRGSSCAQCAWR